MKKGILSLFLVIAFGYSCPAGAQVARTAQGLSESEQLGITAGAALACNAGAKLDDFELIASRIIANQASTAEVEKDEYTKFAQSKLKAYREQKDNPQMSCGEVLSSFNRLPIFRSVVYADGSVKMPNGSLLKPKRAVVKTKSPQVKASSSRSVKSSVSGQKGKPQKGKAKTVKPVKQVPASPKKSIAIRPFRKK